MKSLVFCFVAWTVLVAGVGCAHRTQPTNPTWSPSPSQARLVDLTAQRLEMASEVAWYKFREGLPVLDREREAASLKLLVEQGQARGLPASTVRRFFQAQMAASRMVQADLMRYWKEGNPLPAAPPRDLKREVRPQLDAFNTGLLTQLAEAGPAARGPELKARATRYLLARGLPEAATSKAVSPFN